MSASEKIAAIRAKSGRAEVAPRAKTEVQGDRPQSASEKVAAIRARAVEKKAGGGSTETNEVEMPTETVRERVKQARSVPSAVKPEVKATTKTVSAAPDRPKHRGLGWLAAGLVVVLAVGFWVARSSGPNVSESVEFRNGTELPKGQVDDSRASDAGVFLVHGTLPDGSDGVYAVSARCTFWGCGLTWDASDKRFVCPCHGCSYDLQGRPTGGPAPGALPRLAVSKSGEGGVRVDRLREVEAGLSEEPGAIRAE